LLRVEWNTVRREIAKRLYEREILEGVSFFCMLIAFNYALDMFNIKQH